MPKRWQYSHNKTTHNEVVCPFWGIDVVNPQLAWWRHQMEAFSALLTICAGNSPVKGEFPAQKPVTRNFDVFFDLRVNKRLSKQWLGWWFEMPSRPLWRHCNGVYCIHGQIGKVFDQYRVSPIRELPKLEEWINNSIPDFTIDVNTYPCWVWN